MGFSKLALLCMPAWLAAQPAFEAATVKPADPSANGFMTRASRSQVELRNGSPRQFIETAYGLREYALSGPAWLDSEHYDIVAKLPSGSPQGPVGPMLQTLLAERFQLKVHTEMRDLPGYALVVAKGAPKLHSSAPDGSTTTSFGRSMVRCRSVSLAVFVDQLSRALERPVADATSMQGAFDFDLRWTQDDNPPGSTEPSTPGPSLFAAIQEQLGLKLEARKLPASIVVVDSVNRVPTGN